MLVGNIRSGTDRGRSRSRACAGRGTDLANKPHRYGTTVRVTTTWLATIASGRLGSGLDDVAPGSRITRQDCG